MGGRVIMTNRSDVNHLLEKEKNILECRLLQFLLRFNPKVSSKIVADFLIFNIIFQRQ